MNQSEFVERVVSMIDEVTRNPLPRLVCIQSFGSFRVDGVGEASVCVMRKETLIELVKALPEADRARFTFGLDRGA